MPDDLYDVFGNDGERIIDRLREVLFGAKGGTSLEFADSRGAVSGSHQTLAADLELDPDSGTSDAGDTDFLAPIMGNLLGEDLTATNVYLAGMIGMLSLLGSRGSDLPIAGVLGIVADGVEDADGAVVALIDGSDPSSVTRVGAMFRARMLNANAGSGADYGLDLQDGDPPDIFSDPSVPLSYAKAAIRLGDDVVIMQGDGAPVDGTTGDDFAGKGSTYVDRTNGKEYINTGTITASTWVVKGTQS